MDSDKKVVKLLRRFESMKEIRRRFEPLWKEAMWHVSPVMFDFDGERRDKPYEISKRVTNRPANFLNTCVSGICGYAVSPQIRWFKLGLASDFTSRQIGVQQWLEACETILRRTFEWCGFYTKIPLWVEQSAIFGQSALLIEELHNQDNPIRYTVPEVYEIYLNNGDCGEVSLTAGGDTAGLPHCSHLKQCGLCISLQMTEIMFWFCVQTGTAFSTVLPRPIPESHILRRILQPRTD